MHLKGIVAKQKHSHLKANKNAVTCFLLVLIIQI